MFFPPFSYGRNNMITLFFFFVVIIRFSYRVPRSSTLPPYARLTAEKLTDSKM